VIYKRTLSWPFGAYARGSDMRFEFDAVSAAFDQLVYLVEGLTPDQQLIDEVNQAAIAAATQGAADQALITGYTITQSRDRAEQAASAALASENLSEQWAVNPEDAEVTTGRYSSLHYSKKASRCIRTTRRRYDSGGYRTDATSNDCQRRCVVALRMQG